MLAFAKVAALRRNYIIMTTEIERSRASPDRREYTRILASHRCVRSSIARSESRWRSRDGIGFVFRVSILLTWISAPAVLKVLQQTFLRPILSLD
jgi:non-ribosomal peptide synthetase component F